MRSVAGLLLAIVVAGASGAAAMADDASGAGGTAKGYVDEAGDPTAEVAKVSVTSIPPTPGGTPTNCAWQQLIADDTDVEMYDLNGKRMYSPTGRWYQKVCDGGPVQVNGSFAVPGRSPADPAVLAQQARRSVTIPDPPMATSPRADRRLYTGVPTWLWVDPNWWRPYSATARAAGVSATVVARPTLATWTMGDGGRVTCASPGTEWRPGLAEERSTCSYVYENSSAGQRAEAFAMTVDVEFEVSWTSSIGRGGTLAGIARSASRTVQVGEIQAVETA